MTDEKLSIMIQEKDGRGAIKKQIQTTFQGVC